MPLQEWSDDIWVLSLGAEPALSDDLASAYLSLREKLPPVHIVIDLSNVEHLNSSALSKLLRIRKIQIDHERGLRLAAVPDGVWALFLTTGLDKVFEFSEDVATALTSLQMD
jgi:anti-anti-sigma factor